MFKALALVTGLSLANAAIDQDFALASNDITGPNLELAQFATGFGCTGGNVSPNATGAMHGFMSNAAKLGKTKVEMITVRQAPETKMPRA